MVLCRTTQQALELPAPEYLRLILETMKNNPVFLLHYSSALLNPVQEQVLPRLRLAFQVFVRGLYLVIKVFFSPDWFEDNLKPVLS